MDGILRQDLLVVRLQAQLVIWLALALSIRQQDDYAPQSDSFSSITLVETWLHFTILAKITVIYFESHRDRWTLSRRALLSWNSGYYLAWAQHVPPASWLTSIFLTIAMAVGFHMKNDVILSVQVFVTSSLVLWVRKWYADRKAKIAREIEAIPTSSPSQSLMGAAGSAASVDESRWYSWDEDQTWDWLVRFIENHNENGLATRILSLLAPHRLKGAVLDSLSVEHLVQIFQVPYGPAVLIGREIATLMQRYPKPYTYDNPIGMNGAASPYSWIDAHDREYNQPSRPSQTTDSATKESGENSDDLAHKESSVLPMMDPEQEERIATVMKERYGLELPTIRTSTRVKDTESSQKVSIIMEEEDTRIIQPNSTPLALPRNSEHSMSRQRPRDDPHSTLSNIMGQMPPNIREIAQRRPDLLQALLTQKQQQVRSMQGEMSTVLETEGEDPEDETTSLIQRRPRTKYKATDGELV